MKVIGGVLLAAVLALPLGAQESASSPMLYETEQAGERLFLQRCSVCHLPSPAGDTYGPPFEQTIAP